jgi:hypothetical protein
MPNKRKKKKDTEMIFTSPDGGNTIYGAPINGKGPKVLISKSNKAYIEEEHQHRQYYMTERAVEMCWKHKGLQKAWEKYIVLLELYGYED